jgi:hypothetical protein
MKIIIKKYFIEKKKIIFYLNLMIIQKNLRTLYNFLKKKNFISLYFNIILFISFVNKIFCSFKILIIKKFNYY